MSLRLSLWLFNWVVSPGFFGRFHALPAHSMAYSYSLSHSFIIDYPNKAIRPGKLKSKIESSFE